MAAFASEVSSFLHIDFLGYFQRKVYLSAESGRLVAGEVFGSFLTHLVVVLHPEGANTSRLSQCYLLEA